MRTYICNAIDSIKNQKQSYDKQFIRYPKHYITYIIMTWTNYHGHSNYCDGKGSIESYVLKAIEKNIAILGISSHAPVPFDISWTMKEEKLHAYLSEIQELKEKYKDQIELLTSLEIDYIAGKSGPDTKLIQSALLDYKIVSVHFVDFLLNGDPWSIESNAQVFERGLQEVFHGDVVAAVKRFYEVTRHVSKTKQFDIIGHFDRIKLQNLSKPFFDEKSKWYMHEIEQTLQTFVDNNIIVEINTKMLYKKDHHLLFPGIEHFEMMKSLGVKVTINSDAHRPEDLTSGFEYVAKELKKAGYTKTTEFIDGGWEQVAFSEKGILL